MNSTDSIKSIDSNNITIRTSDVVDGTPFRYSNRCLMIKKRKEKKNAKSFWRECGRAVDCSRRRGRGDRQLGTLAGLADGVCCALRPRRL